MCDDGYVWALKSSVGILPSCELEKGKTRVEFMIDTGASCNVVDEETWLSLNIRPVLQKSLVRLFAYGSTTPLPILGEFKARTKIKGEFHLREGIEKAMQLMLDNDIIEKSEGPTPWVSQIVPIMKESGEIRICLDSKIINTAIERQCHSSPTPDEVAINLNGAKVISKFDLKNAFNQYELAPECRYITVFYTHMGLYRFKTLRFGINCASEVFQRFIEELIADLKNV